MEKQSIRVRNRASRWVRGACIGRGCFGAVSSAVRRSDGGVFAVKSVDLATCLPAQAESLENEISVLRSLEPHPCVVGFIGDDVSREGTASFRNLHMEYLPHGDVASAYGEINEALLRQYAWCLVSALRHVHSCGFVHCDVKARNVLVALDRNSVKLADFGSAIRFRGCGPTALMTPRGSPLWMAPEVIRREYQGPESDVWSLGCTVIEMFTGKPAWEDRGLDSLSRIGFSDELPIFPAGLSELGRDFLDKCLKREPSQRWSCDQLLQHPFLSQDRSSSSTESSPRCVLHWVNSEFDDEEEETETGSRHEGGISAMARISKLARTEGAIWESDGWVEVRDRDHAPEEEGTSTTSKECPNSPRVTSEFSTSTAVDEWQNRNYNNLGAAAVNVPPSENIGSAAVPSELLLVIKSLEIWVKVNIQIYSISVTSSVTIIQFYCNKKANIIFSIPTQLLFLSHVIRTEQSQTRHGVLGMTVRVS